jgi:hypothetical protein
MNEHFAKLVFFLLELEREKPYTMYATWRVNEVVDSLAAIMNVEPYQLRDLVK